MSLDWKTGLLAIGAVAIWVLFFALGGGEKLGLGATEQGKVLASRALRDPSSAQFRDVFRYNGNVCGEINGKNGFGAYSGFRRFYTSEGKAEIEPDQTGSTSPGVPSASEMFELSWRINCGR